jgi:glycosyltransferase involved in cell wall biosynthesis
VNISLVIPAHNEEQYLRGCLQSVAPHVSRLLEVIVVDNASTDDTANVARKFGFARVVHEPRKGLLWARQRGFLESRGDHLAYMDTDCRMQPAWADIVEQEFGANPQIAALSGPARYYDLPRLHRFLGEVGWWLSAPLAYRIVGYTVWGGNFVVSRSALQTIGGFNTALTFYGEDMDLARRLAPVGKVKFFMRFYAFTSGRRISQAGLVRTFWIYAVNFLWEVLFGKPFSQTHDNHR